MRSEVLSYGYGTFYTVTDITLSFYKMKEVMNWCHATFGSPSSIQSGGRWNHVTSDMIYFKNEVDLNWFLLRWS